MGYTDFSIQLVDKYLKKGMSILDFGSQNNYSTAETPPPFMSDWFIKNGAIEYMSIDLGGDNHSVQLDCAYPLPLEYKFDLVCDFGFSEHCVQMKEYNSVVYDNNITSVYPKGEINIEQGFYNCWLNQFNLCKKGGYIISENPKAGNWPGHGYSYLNEDFYMLLPLISGCNLIDVGSHPAMGNSLDGWNVYAVLKKTKDKFPDYKEFLKLPIYKK